MKTLKYLVREIGKLYNGLVELLPNVVAHGAKFQLSMCQYHNFLQSFSQRASKIPLTEAHMKAFITIKKFSQNYQDIFTQNYSDCWAQNFLENQIDYVPTLLCQYATALQEATMDLDPIGARAFNSAAPEWLQYHIFDLKAIEASLNQYLANPDSDDQITGVVEKRINQIHEFIQAYEGKTFGENDVVFSPIPIIFQQWRLLYSDLEIEKEIGSGVSSNVYIGILKKTKEKVAIKALKFEQLQGAKLNAFQRELSVLASAQHECLLRFVGATDTYPFCIVTEWMPGGSLYNDLNNTGNLSPTERSIAMFDIARGMRCLHNRHIIHRDLKTLNVLIDANNRAKIIDFGLSRYANEQFMSESIGTPHWMAPELLGSSKQYDLKVDVYAYAIVCWEILMCEVPYEGLLPPQIIARVLINDLRPPLEDDCPPGLRRLITSCWQRDPNMRPSFNEIITMFAKCDIYVPGTDMEVFENYIKTKIAAETEDIDQKMKTAVESGQALSIVKVIEENGIPENRGDYFLSLVSEIRDFDLKVRGLKPFFFTPLASKATFLVKQIGYDRLSPSSMDLLINTFPTGNDDVDTTIFVIACKAKRETSVILRSVNARNVQLAFELISRGGAESGETFKAVVDVAVHAANDHRVDSMLAASAVRCLAKLGALDKLGVSYLMNNITSTDPTFMAVCTSALAQMVEKGARLDNDQIKRVYDSINDNSLAVLVLSIACNDHDNAETIVRLDLAKKLNQDLVATIYLRACQHKDIAVSLKQQLERLLPTIQDINIVNLVRSTLDAM
ncbi:TKL family protein kinase [Trichomonas vaginalis G3]|uniref:TKL family protein kinase n=1 Tax=Trichomonas vaginalis (strain ATCC PRA-98 / G3) TaxID=412133 RepID=A2DH69_TRIV3|nr:protein kinase protein [Trichomonas vaginalis G3]EAY20142.1 TKL family protein kinase [Trichomonas vaginalis G3]KAI5507609.1 protein kinase protein [Trichomonas vaginalis G3]|eukprot:XP_001581128.1 TKL family protein kinase [Trichomonas vaginalis G3]